jgi:hypothetical protein
MSKDQPPILSNALRHLGEAMKVDGAAILRERLPLLIRLNLLHLRRAEQESEPQQLGQARG